MLQLSLRVVLIFSLTWDTSKWITILLINCNCLPVKLRKPSKREIILTTNSQQTHNKLGGKSNPGKHAITSIVNAQSLVIHFVFEGEKVLCFI